MTFQRKDPACFGAAGPRSLSCIALDNPKVPQNDSGAQVQFGLILGIFVEHVSARPGEGAVGAFAFGRSRGVIEGVLAAAGVRCQFRRLPHGSAQSACRLAATRSHRAPPRFSAGQPAPSCSHTKKMTALPRLL